MTTLSSSQPPEKKTLLPRGKGPWAFAFFLIALVLTFFVGALVQRSFFPAQYVEVGALLARALQSPTLNEDLKIQFSETKTIPMGPGLKEWLDDYPAASRIRRIEADYVAAYTVDPMGDWDLLVDPETKTATLYAPLPELRDLIFQSDRLRVIANPPLNSEEKDLLESYLLEPLRLTLMQEEEARRNARFVQSQEPLKKWAQSLLEQSGRTDYQIVVKYAGDFFLREENE